MHSSQYCGQSPSKRSIEIQCLLHFYSVVKLKNELHFVTDYNSDILQIYLFYFIYMCRYLSVSMYPCIPTKVRRGHKIPFNWSYGVVGKGKQTEVHYKGNKCS